MVHETEQRDPNEWFWCLSCQRVFQGHDLAESWAGEAACPFCFAAGLHIDIYEWNSWPKRYPRLLRHWPDSVAKLARGLRLPLRPAFSILP